MAEKILGLLSAFVLGGVAGFFYFVYCLKFLVEHNVFDYRIKLRVLLEQYEPVVGPFQLDLPPDRVAAMRAGYCFSDPGKQALEMLRRGENCDWYSITHNLNETHEGFDCLEIYWRTNVEHPEQNEFYYGRGPFELKAGFRVRWHVSATHHSYVEACGLDLLTTILEARERADQLIARAQVTDGMGCKHPALEAWKARGPDRKYDFNGLDLEKWSVRLEYPGGLSWAEHEDLDQAIVDALAKGPK